MFLRILDKFVMLCTESVHYAVYIVGKNLIIISIDF